MRKCYSGEAVQTHSWFVFQTDLPEKLAASQETGDKSIQYPLPLDVLQERTLARGDLAEEANIPIVSIHTEAQ